MTKRDGVHWRCPDADWDCSMVATMPIEGETAPRCVCGRLMQKTEKVPVFHYLDFLREQVEEIKEAQTEKE